jgi:hypothetical protein
VFLSRCKERLILHFTHQVDAEKPTRIVLLGLYDMPVEEIREALAIHNVVPPMRIRHSRFLEHNNFILYFKKGTMTTAKLRDIEAINSIKVRWAYYDAKRHGPTQCRRCQEWGHGSSHCHIAPACVKCAGDHETSACTLAEKGAKVPDANLKCANCKQAHTANYGGCPTLKEFIASRPQKKQPKSMVASTRDSRRSTRTNNVGQSCQKICINNRDRNQIRRLTISRDRSQVQRHASRNIKAQRPFISSSRVRMFNPTMFQSMKLLSLERS